MKQRRERKPRKGGGKKASDALPELINGRAMMAVSILYENIVGKGLDHPESRGIKYLQDFLRDYKRYQEKVRHALAGCYEVLTEERIRHHETVDKKHLRLITKTIKEEMKNIWKTRKKETVDNEQAND